MIRARVSMIGIIGILISLLLASGVRFIGAQSITCEIPIQQAVESLNQNCSGAVGSSACYGSSASATLVGDGSFAQPGDVVDLASVHSITTLPLSAEHWGLAMLHVQANVPLALSATGLHYFLMGDTQIENAVESASAFTPVQPITVSSMVGANLRSRPTTEGQIVGNASVGTELSADGLSADQAWLRVLNQSDYAWISRQIVAEKDGRIEDLPVLSSNSKTLMQSFFLRTGTETLDCADAPPSLLLIQSPEGLDASITVNGLDVRFNSTIVLRVLPDNNLQLITLNGGTVSNGVTIPAGFTVTVPLADNSRSVAGAVTGLRPINAEERQFLTLAAGVVGDTLLYTPLTVPTQEQVAATFARLGGGGSGGGPALAGPAAGQADCSRFRPTSPLGSLALGITPFFWDAAPGATSYRIKIYGPDGGLRASLETSAQSTTFSTDTGAAIGDGSNFAWNVEALVNGQVACTSATVNLPRDAFGQQVSNQDSGGALATPTACTWSC